MLKSIPGNRTLDTLSANGQREQRIELAQKSTAPAPSPEKQTTKQRFLENLGLPALAPRHGFKAPPLRRPTVALLPTTPATAALVSPQPLADELTFLKNQLLNQMQALPTLQADQHKRFLNNIPLCKDPVRQILLLNLLGASITTAVKRLEIEGVNASTAQPSMWDHLARTSTSVEVQKSVSSLPNIGEDALANEVAITKPSDK